MPRPLLPGAELPAGQTTGSSAVSSPATAKTRSPARRSSSRSTICRELPDALGCDPAIRYRFRWLARRPTLTAASACAGCRRARFRWWRAWAASSAWSHGGHPVRRKHPSRRSRHEWPASPSMSGQDALPRIARRLRSDRPSSASASTIDMTTAGSTILPPRPAVAAIGRRKRPFRTTSSSLTAPTTSSRPDFQAERAKDAEKFIEPAHGSTSPTGPTTSSSRCRSLPPSCASSRKPARADDARPARRRSRSPTARAVATARTRCSIR